jgi:hypothetical protein
VLWWKLIASGLVFGAAVTALGLSPLYGIGVVIIVFIGAGTTGCQSLSNALR